MNGVPSGYGPAASPEIQAQWLIDLLNMMSAKGGIGIIYWEPAYIASHVSGCPAETGGSVWENIALFDFNNNLMPNGGIRFCQLLTGINPQVAMKNDISLEVLTYAANSEPEVRFQSEYTGQAFFGIYTVEGRLVNSYSETIHIGLNRFTLRVRSLTSKAGVYVLRLNLNNKMYYRNFILVN